MKKPHIETIINILDKLINYQEIESIYLFGSCAKNKASFNSDVDLACFLNVDKDYKLYRTIRGEITDKISLPDPDINLWFNSVNKEILLTGNTFEKSIYNDLILLWDKENSFSKYYYELMGKLKE